MLEWKKRCKKDTTLVSDRKIWETKCGSYKVVFSHITLGNGEISDTYYAIFINNQENNRTETIVSRHRKKNPAIKSCETHFKKQQKKRR